MARVIRDFGQWALVCEEGVKVFIDRTTGQRSEDPPDSVLEILAHENAKLRQPVYEPTPHRLPPMQDPESPPRVEAEEPLDCYGGESALLLRGLLAPEECSFVVAQAEALGLKDCGISKRVRVTDRLAVMAEDLARKLFERAKPFLPPLELQRTLDGRAPFGVPEDVAPGTWVPTGLNPCFRVCRYEPGGFFRPHHDGGFDYSRRHRSLKTFMMYLNDGFEGGATSFYQEAQRHYAQPDRSKVLCDIRPERGACLVFNHCICHDGGEVKEGLKYLLRTEVMYELSSGPDEDGDSVDSDSDF